MSLASVSTAMPGSCRPQDETEASEDTRDVPKITQGASALHGTASGARHGLVTGRLCDSDHLIPLQVVKSQSHLISGSQTWPGAKTQSHPSHRNLGLRVLI